MERQFRSHRQISPVRQIRGRSRSPLQQQRQSPPCTPLRPRGRSPAFNVSGIIYSETNASRKGIDAFQPLFSDNKSFPVGPKQVPEKQHILQGIEGVASSNTIDFHPFKASQIPLRTMPIIAPRQETEKDVFGHKDTIQQPVSNHGFKMQDTGEHYIEDPHFVLGVREGALEKEILEAYQKQMWGIELGRVADTNYTEAPGLYNVWDQSVAQLCTAKK
ncbi:hypothetical protein DID88_002904 [Monilinia fructigena]|uniref:Uncharacterized protein n=1 Tax=Monilinia fructigena TaxID=38457 RepID=A0A395INW6_9HELO|nr:hypothetical protein DID88_002904 [Monilinia fructigena]